MLNKYQIIEILKELSLPTDQYWVVTGAAMVLHGVKDVTHDVDLGCTSSLCNMLEAKGYICTVMADGIRRVNINNTIEVFENWFVDEIELIEGIPTASLESIIKQKQKLGRGKDFKDIELINSFLNKPPFKK